jgi:phage terminase large subunit-like protein
MIAMSNGLLDPFLTPATLAMALWPEGRERWIPQKHLMNASSRIVHHIMRGDGRLVVSMPPRHGKSRLVSESTIPWFLEKFPGMNILFVAYNGDFAEEWGMKAKDIIKKRQDLFSYNVREDRSRVDRFETTRGNICWFGGINGGVTGKGAHLVIIDDYIKGIEQAMSKNERDKMWNNFIANIYTRLEPGASVIIVATRWWSDDLIGRILTSLQVDPITEQPANIWENICFPGIYRPMKDGLPDFQARDILGRSYGDVLFPERYPIRRLAELQRAMKLSGTIFEALFQQTPIDNQTTFTDGRWLQVIKQVAPEGHRFVRAWDFAATQGGGDWLVGTKMSRKGRLRQAYVWNIIRKQLSPNKIETEIRRAAVADGTETTVLLETEPGSQSLQLFEHYKKNVLPEFTVISVPAGNKNKTVKAIPFIASAEGGNVFCVDNSGVPESSLVGPNGQPINEPEWVTTFRDEFSAFPPSSGGHDDQVDTASMGYNHLFSDEPIDIAWGQTNYEHQQLILAGKIVQQRINPDLQAGYERGKTGGGGKIFKGLTW